MRRFLTALFIACAIYGFGVPLAHAAPFQCPPETESIAGVCVTTSPDLPDTDIRGVVVVFLNWLAFIFGSLALITLVICGIMYLMAAGDESQAENAKTCIKWAIIGIFVAGGAYTIVAGIAFLSYGLPPYF